MIRTIVCTALGLTLMAGSAEAQVYCRAEGVPHGCVWAPRAGPGVGAPGPFGYPHPLDVLPAGVGNKAIALRHCRQVTVRDLTILHGGHFAILAAACDNVTVDHVFIDTNRDGIDIDACANVRISHCSVNSPWDDGICVKASCGFGGVRPVENVTISDCYVSGFEEGTLYDGTRSRVINHRGGPIGRIKLGTEASGGFRNIRIRDCAFERYSTAHSEGLWPCCIKTEVLCSMPTTCH